MPQPYVGGAKGAKLVISAWVDRVAYFCFPVNHSDLSPPWPSVTSCLEKTIDNVFPKCVTLLCDTAGATR